MGPPAGVCAADVASSVLLTSGRRSSGIARRVNLSTMPSSGVHARLSRKLIRRGSSRSSERTGLLVATAATGLLWLLEVPGVRDAAERGDALFGTIDTWLIWNLTGGPRGGVHVTDVTNASRTMLMNLETLDWDPGLLAALGIPRAMLPAIRPSSEAASYGTVTGIVADSAPLDWPVCGALGDQ